jgi:CRISPR-associated endonuclease Cas2
MKLSLTDEFLWNLYDMLEKGNDVVDFLFFTSPVQKGRIMIGSTNPFFKKIRHEKGRKKFSQLIYKAKIRGLIKIKNLEGKKAMMLTKKGMGKALRASFAMQGKKKRSDGKWLMVIFDIPQDHAKARSLLRSVLQNLGYKMFQQSVWVTPYDVSEKTEKLLQFYSLEGYVKIFLIEELDIS